MDDVERIFDEVEATLSRQAEVDYLLVADRAEVVAGKLYLMGGAWDRMRPTRFPHTMVLGLAIGIRIPYRETDGDHRVSILIEHEETRLVGFEAKLTTGRPPGMQGMDMLVPMAFNLPITVPHAGLLHVRAEVDGRHGRSHRVRVALRTQGPTPSS
jgi:hypothetical protein